MLEITIKAGKLEQFDYEKNEFVYYEQPTDLHLLLEHSLVSISKWESKWHKPFLNKDKKTSEEMLDYVRCMIVGQNVPIEALRMLTKDDFTKINKYIEDPMTATTFHVKAEKKKSPIGLEYTKPRQETLTSELIYYSMIEHEIPDRFEKWHLNRLLTLIRVCNVKAAEKEKASQRESAAQNRGMRHSSHMPRH